MLKSAGRTSWWRHTPSLISAARLVAAPVLLCAVLLRRVDLVVTFVAPYAVYVFRSAATQPRLAAMSCIAGLYILEAGAAFFRYGRISSFHTVLVRIAAHLQGVFVMYLFLWGFADWLFVLMFAVTLVAYTEELALVAILPEWKADVRGLYWVLRA